MKVPFECDLCHFRNMNKRDPVLGFKKDEDTHIAIRRAQLDVFWAREPSTVLGNLSRMRRDYIDATAVFSLGDNVLPYLPNHEVVDRVGMVAAILTLSASLRKGIYCKHVQPDTARKTSAWYGNAHDAGAGYVGLAIGHRGSFASDSPTTGEWYSRMVRGMKLRTGVVRYHNEALTSKMILALDDMLEMEWHGCTHVSQREAIEEFMSFVLIGFGAGLRGEEIPLVSMNGLLYFWDETRVDADPFIMITLFGRFKGETGHRWHCLPICDRNRSGIPFRKWIGRLLHRRVVEQKRTKGWLFKKGKRRSKLSDFDEMLDHYIRRVHGLCPSLFSVGTILEMFSTWRSMRRGAILETTGRVDESVVNLMNRWRTKEGAKGTTPGLSMRQTYTQVRDLFSQLKLYSKAL